ncbi:ABC transporter permease [Deinococcus ruber]|uniref:ABC transporter permease n=1 Tax=Deinococcus ruber TaxID=1848197 RepID=A0A918FA27_9DEIO|nr:ABC transporter permease [Deinococcus ruber]
MTAAPLAAPPRVVGRSAWAVAMRRFRRHKLAMTCLVIIVLLVMMAVFAPFISPHDPNAQDLTGFYAVPSPQFLFGKDDLGRDILSRIIWGSRISLLVGFSVAAIGILIGIFMGVLAGFYGGRTDALISRFIELMLSLPTLPLLLVISGLLAATDSPAITAFRTALGAGASVVIVVAVLSLFGWMGTARLVRGETLRLRNLEYMDAARALGARNARLMLRHLVPNLLPIVIVQATLDVGGAILTEAALSFLGFGIQPPVSTWGNMLSNAQEVVLQYPWIPFFPGLMILITVLSFNFLGDGLRDALDPRSRL